jgi:hypothetical protein
MLSHFAKKMPEQWNNDSFSKNPTFQHFRFPMAVQLANPLGALTYVHIEDRFWTRVVPG